MLGKRDVPKGVVSTGEVEKRSSGIGGVVCSGSDLHKEIPRRPCTSISAVRYLLVMLIYLGRGVAMPVTARDITRGERRSRHERDDS